jgi:hypothetical protein
MQTNVKRPDEKYSACYVVVAWSFGKTSLKIGRQIQFPFMGGGVDG